MEGSGAKEQALDNVWWGVLGGAKGLKQCVLGGSLGSGSARSQRHNRLPAALGWDTQISMEDSSRQIKLVKYITYINIVMPFDLWF